MPTRTVTVDPQRLAGWLDAFARRHGTPRVRLSDAELVLTSPDGGEARVQLIWGPLTGDPIAALLASTGQQRRLGALLVRKSGHAAGVFEAGTLVAHRTGHHYVQGRTKAGGWSQQRYARRRDNQAVRAYAKAAADAETVLLAHPRNLDGLILGGDPAGLRAVLATPGLTGLDELARRLPYRVLPVGAPGLSVLKDVHARFVAVPIVLNEAAQEPGPSAPAHEDDQPGSE